MDRRMFRIGLALMLTAALAACGPKATDDVNALDAELTDGNAAGNARDPALMSALHDQIMVDPALTQQTNTAAVRPPAQPYAGEVPIDTAAPPTPAATAAANETLKATPAAKADCPGCKAARQSLTLGALAARQKDKRASNCAQSLRYSAAWANRLPADLPLYPDARVSEAAGVQDAGCTVRAVSFASAAKLGHVLDWYYTRAGKAGYVADHGMDGGEHMLGGTRRDGSAFALFLTARGDGGTDVDLVTNTGR